MSTLTLICTLLSILVLSWAIWFEIELVRYIITGEYEVDKRLRNICR